MLWKLYFLINVILTIAVVMTGGVSSEPLRVVQSIFGYIGLIGLFCYAFDRYSFNKIFWRIIFWAEIFSLGLSLIFQSPSSPKINGGDLPAAILVVLLLGLLSVPYYFALYSLSVGKTHKQKPMGWIGIQATKVRK